MQSALLAIIVHLLDLFVAGMILSRMACSYFFALYKSQRICRFIQKSSDTLKNSASRKDVLGVNVARRPSYSSPMKGEDFGYCQSCFLPLAAILGCLTPNPSYRLQHGLPR